MEDISATLLAAVRGREGLRGTAQNRGATACDCRYVAGGVRTDGDRLWVSRR